MVALAGSSRMALENDAGTCASEECEGAASGMFSSTACVSVLAMHLQTVASAIFTQSSGTSKSKSHCERVIPVLRICSNTLCATLAL
jgi:hypothetical protein